MNRKLISAIICGVLAFSLVSCGNNKEKINESNSNVKVEEKVVEGTWSKDYTKDEVTSFHNDILTKVEDLTKIYELDYEMKEVVKEENGVPVKVSEIYLDNLNAESNRLKSMHYNFKIYGENSSEGQITLTIGFNLDKALVLEDGEFNFETTSMGAYSEAFTGIDNRDYTELNNSIYDIISGEAPKTKIENNLDGIIETVNITDDYLLYKLETKKYTFLN